MNVYRVEIETEKVDESWTVGAGSPNSAIGKIIRRTKQTSAKRMTIYCNMVAKNIEYKTWKEQQTPPPSPYTNA